MEEWLALLLPVAAASGWFAAKRVYTQKYLVRHTEALRRAYCRGLNYLLNEKTDKAIETFASLLAEDVETIETHIALGNLFRRRGEVEKAIAVHEDLIGRENLSDEQRVCAQFELGVDYLRSGLYDRAESILSNLVDRSTHRKAALELLLSIYQQERDWRKAADCVRQLRAISKTPRSESEAQFLCEMAVDAVAANRFVEARQHVDAALAEDAACARASLIKADLLLQEGAYDAALETLNKVQSQNPAYSPEILDRVAACYDALGRPRGELIAYLKALYEVFGHDEVADRIARYLLDDGESEQALAFLATAARDRPTLAVLSRMNALLLETVRPSQRASLEILSHAVDRMRMKQPRYRCVQCGFSGAELHWRCPSCSHWESTKPITSGVWP